MCLVNFFSHSCAILLFIITSVIQIPLHFKGLNGKRTKTKNKIPLTCCTRHFFGIFFGSLANFFGGGGGVKEGSHQSLPKNSGKEDKNGVLMATLVIFE